MNGWVTAPSGLELALLFLVLIGAALIVSLPAYGRLLMAWLSGDFRNRVAAGQRGRAVPSDGEEPQRAGGSREIGGSADPQRQAPAAAATAAGPIVEGRQFDLPLQATSSADAEGRGRLDLACKMDLAATSDGLELILELPGVEEKDLEIRVIDGAITISGEIRQPADWKDHAFRVVERNFGPFSRSLELPEGVRADRIKAFLNLGLLKVTIPNPTKPEPKTIVVQAGDMRLNPTTHGLELTVDLPGLEEQDIDVTVSGDMLIIRGERRAASDASGEGRAFVECGHEVFSRSIELPGGANIEQISAVMRRGELKVTIPVPTKAATKIIDVCTAA